MQQIYIGPDKKHTKFKNSPLFCNRSPQNHSLHENAQKLTGKTMRGQILDTMMKYIRLAAVIQLAKSLLAVDFRRSEGSSLHVW